jgi:hypothetical protein
MGKYPEHRKSSGYRKCDICGKTFIARGIGTHIREAHKMEINTVVKPSITNYSNDSITPVIGSSKNLQPKTIPVKAMQTQEFSKVNGKELMEMKRSDGPHSYTDKDLQILLARISQVELNTYTGNLIGWWDNYRITRELIQDFERRFECKFDDAKRANLNINSGQTNSEIRQLISKYASLKYSR